MEPTNNEYVSCIITEIEDNKINVKGYIKNPGNYHKMIIMAPNPIDTITSFSGKGLPFPCEMIAFENTPNFETIQSNGEFNVVFLYPNSYYGNREFVLPIGTAEEVMNYYSYAKLNYNIA